VTAALWCVLAAILLPYAAVGIAKWTRRYDNVAPRDWEATLEGRARRAYHAHLNHFEALPGFAAAVIIAHLAGVRQVWLDAIAIAFIALRIAYTWAYLADKATLRSLLWAGGIGCVVALFIASALAR
jgi:uncharacterized MAPEG superfamily protein